MAPALSAKQALARALVSDIAGNGAVYDDQPLDVKRECLFHAGTDLARLRKAGFDVVPRKLTKVRRRRVRS